MSFKLIVWQQISYQVIIFKLITSSNFLSFPKFSVFNYCKQSWYTMQIHKEGRFILLTLLLIVVLINFVTYHFLPPVLLLLTGIGGLVLLGLTLNFFRNPTRNIPNMP